MARLTLRRARDIGAKHRGRPRAPSRAHSMGAAARRTLAFVAYVIAGTSLARLVVDAASSEHAVSFASMDAPQRTSHVTRPGPHPALPLNHPLFAASPDVTAPTQIHLVPTGPDEVTVVWATRVAVDPVVSYGPAKAPTARLVRGQSTSYTSQICLASGTSLAPSMGPLHPVKMSDLVYLANTSRWADADAANYKLVTLASQVIPDDWFTTGPWTKSICLAYSNPDANYESPLIHAVALTGLTPGAFHSYTLPGASNVVRTFKAAPSPVDLSAAMRLGGGITGGGAASATTTPMVTLAVVGDTGQTEVTSATLRQVLDASPDVVIHTGDLSYADGFPPRWDSMGVLHQELMSAVPSLFVAGTTRATPPWHPFVFC